MQKTNNISQNLKKSELKLIILDKLSDDAFNGNHPNNIQQGYTKRGLMLVPPIVGQRFWLDNFSTSVVTKILKTTNKSIKFKTLYSTYKITYVNINKLIKNG